jgi:hypothetical protein
MIFFYALSGVGVVAVGLAIGDLFRRKSQRPGISSKNIDAHKATTLFGQGLVGQYLPPPRDDRPPH